MKTGRIIGLLIAAFCLFVFGALIVVMLAGFFIYQRMPN